MKLLLVLLVVALLSVSAVACGGASKGTGLVSPASSTTTASTNATPTGTTSARERGEAGGNDEDITHYGHEASSADKRAITALVQRYYAAVAADDGAKACSLIYSILAESIPEDYGQAPGPSYLRGLKTCPAIMSKLFKRIPGQPAAVLATTEVTGVRLNGNHGFAQLHSSAMSTGKIFVERERRTWKIGSLIGVACTMCAAR